MIEKKTSGGLHMSCEGAGNTEIFAVLPQAEQVKMSKLDTRDKSVLQETPRKAEDALPCEKNLVSAWGCGALRFKKKFVGINGGLTRAAKDPRRSQGNSGEQWETHQKTQGTQREI